MRLQHSATTLIVIVQNQHTVCSGGQPWPALRPLDQHGGIIQIADSEKFDFLGVGQAIQIDVYDVAAVDVIRFDQGVCRTAYPARKSEAAKKATHQCGFARTQRTA